MTQDEIDRLPTPETDRESDRCSECGLVFVSADFAEQQERRLAAMTAERDALREDAERYRFLRSHNTWLTGAVCDKRFMLREERLDAAIDAAKEAK